MPPAELQQTTEGKTTTVSFPKSKKRVPERTSLPTVIGYNLSEFSLCPLGLKTSHLAHTIDRYEWTQGLANGRERACFFERQYGEVVPNAETEDFLLIFAHLAQKSDDPLRVSTSFFEILKLKGAKHKPSGPQVKRCVRHLEALHQLHIDTNFIYDREKKRWKAAKGYVIGSYEYEDEQGKLRRRKIRKRGDEGAIIEVVSHERVKELSEFHFTRVFYKYFLKDALPIDLATYFALGLPTSKRIYRFGNKYIQTLGHHSVDLQLFCLSRIGMSPQYVVDRRPSYLAKKVRPYAARVTETGEMVVGIEPSSTPSGYKITFNKPTTQIALFSVGTSYTKKEERAYTLLVKHGLYSNVARSLVVKYRNLLGKDGARYITFAARQFKRTLVDTRKLTKIPAKRIPGVLKKAFDKDWFYPHFIEWSAEEDKRQWRDERAKYPDEPLDHASRPRVRAIGERGNDDDFSLEQFRKEYPEAYSRIAEAVIGRYEEFAQYGVLSRSQLQEMIRGSLETFCRECLPEFQKGNMEYFPPLLQDEDSSTRV